MTLADSSAAISRRSRMMREYHVRFSEEGVGTLSLTHPLWGDKAEGPSLTLLLLYQEYGVLDRERYKQRVLTLLTATTPPSMKLLQLLALGDIKVHIYGRRRKDVKSKKKSATSASLATWILFFLFLSGAGFIFSIRRHKASRVCRVGVQLCWGSLSGRGPQKLSG